MHLCRFNAGDDQARVGLVQGETVLDLSAEGIDRITPLLEFPELVPQLPELAGQGLPRFALGEITLLSPVEQQEVWAAGVTYLRSKAARMDESEFSATAYDRVYAAERPELFFKAMPDKVVRPGDAVGIRGDARWSVPEPELALVLNSRGGVVAFTIANDMSSRDIEGENLLYLPQAKIYNRSCAVGPWFTLGISEPEVREWSIALAIEREGERVFEGTTSPAQIKRSFAELAEYLFRCQTFPHGAVLLTGTGIVPADDFTLQAGDRVRIEISGIGVLQNEVVEV
jgi:2-dehydro-3-deoxy-D-arabinonate dehydratase